MRLLILGLGLAFASPVAAQSVFDRLTGVFGSNRPNESCAENRRNLSFSADHGRIQVAWERPVDDSLTADMIRVFEGSVVAFDARSITFLRDGETRSDAEGELILWTYRLHDSGLGFCIGRSDVLFDDCISSHQLCDSLTS